MNPKRPMQQVNPDFDYEAYKHRYDLNATLLDPITNKTYNVCKRAMTYYRSKTYSYLNVNRIPLEFAATLQKGQPLMLFNDKETFLMLVDRTYPPAAKWQNATCKVLQTPLEFMEKVEEWQTLHPQPQTVYIT